MKKKVLVIDGHPDADSFCAALAERYVRGAKASGAEVHTLALRDLAFDPVLHRAYKAVQKLEPGLLRAQKEIRRAQHLVFVYPLWWGAMPAQMKGFIDRAFHPGFAFAFPSATALLPAPLLKGRSARLIVTMDGPPSLIRYLYGDPGVRMMKSMTLEFCGIRPVRVMYAGSVKRATRARRLLWLMQAEDLGRSLT